jgi:replication initiation protein RepC
VRRPRRAASALVHRPIGDSPDCRDGTGAAGSGRDWRAWLDQADSLYRGRSADLDLDVLPALVEQIEAVRAEGEAALGAWLKTVETSSAGALDCTPYTATNTLPADKSATCNEAADEQVGRQRCGSSAPPDQARPAPPNTATAGLAPSVLAKLCSPLRVYLASGRPAWPDVVDAADYLRANLGISRSAWIDACQTLGRNDAAAAVAIIAAKGSEIASAGGYLRGMTARARAGRLNLQGSLWGLAERRADA